MSEDPDDRPYNLLPQDLRRRDAEQEQPLRALLRAIGAQASVLEADIAGLYENWFIETCDCWVVPYLAELVGYRPVPEAAPPPGRALAPRLARILSPRREAANMVRYRRRRGTVRILDELAHDVSGWPVAAVELGPVSFTLPNARLATQGSRLPVARERSAAEQDAADGAGGPFDPRARLSDARRFNSLRTPGLGHPEALALHAWRGTVQKVDRAPALRIDGTIHDSSSRNGGGRPACGGVRAYLYTFSSLGNPVALVAPAERREPGSAPRPSHFPRPIQRADLGHHADQLYGADRSLAVWLSGPDGLPQADPVAVDRIDVADLSDWSFVPLRDRVAIDPQLGRIAIPRGGDRPPDVWVRYFHALAADLGGGSYHRPLRDDPSALHLRVSATRPTGGRPHWFASLRDALDWWRRQAPRRPRILVTIEDDGEYDGDLAIEVTDGERVEVRADEGRRPTVRPGVQGWVIRGTGGTGVVRIDGLLIAGRPFLITGGFDEVAIRHATLVPGLELWDTGRPKFRECASIELYGFQGTLSLRHSISGPIRFFSTDRISEPPRVLIEDSVLDATDPRCQAISGPPCDHRGESHATHAYATLRALRSTVFGEVLVHALELALDTIFREPLSVARRQRGEARTSYLHPGSKPPRLCECQPRSHVAEVLDEASRRAEAQGRILSDPEKEALTREAERGAAPRFRDVRYGLPDYARLDETCPEVIRRGASDGSEMGVFHDLYGPQREAMLKARLIEFTPASTEARIVFDD